MTTDVNIRIDKRTHRLLKMTAAKYEISIKQLVALLSMTKFPIQAANKSIAAWADSRKKI